MSLLLRNQLSIFLSPERVAVLPTQRELQLRGWRVEVGKRVIIPAQGESETEWGGAIAALRLRPALLHRFAQPGGQATVILSNHFVNYTLVPWHDNMSDEDEMAFARHCFQDVYGDVSASWEIRVSPNRAGEATLASAVEKGLLDELRSVLGQASVRVGSIQPHLMVAFNNCHSGMSGRNAWFALLEPRNLCLSLMRNGRFIRMRKIGVGESWNEELTDILERETYLARDGADTNDVFLWAPQLEGKNILAGRWNIMQLKPPLY